jgi:hypothetical protein
MALNFPFSGRIKKNSVDDLDGEMEERRRLIEEAVADLRAKHRYARRPNWRALWRIRSVSRFNAP